MRVGLIARADHTGLGIQSREFFKHIPNCKALVIDFRAMAEGLTEILTPDLSAFPGQQVFKWGSEHNLRGDIPPEIIREFVKDIDILFAMETPYDYNVFDVCRQMGVKIILQLNYEFLDYPSMYGIPKPNLFAAPSMWNFDRVPDPKIYLPVPIVKQPLIEERKNFFLHVAGRVAAEDRNGTDILLKCLRHVKSEIKLHIKSQHPIPPIRKNWGDNVKVILDCTNKVNHLDNYLSGGTLIMPRKYGGLSLPQQEAISFGMPVITTDISPNNFWLPQEWLVPAYACGSFQCKQYIDMFEADYMRLAAKIDQFCDQEFYRTAMDKALEIREALSWENSLHLYIETFNSLK